jgi:predicted nucleic acid-binding protein
MAIYLLDTSVVIDAINRKRGRWELLRTLVEAGDTLACSAVTATEIYAGMRLHEAEVILFRFRMFSLPPPRWRKRRS